MVEAIALGECSMSSFSQEVESKAQQIIDASWSTRDGQVVPTTDTVALSNGAVRLEATYLFADLGNSSGAAQKLKKTVTAKIIRSYLDSASRIIRHFDGEIRSFDGDRVMGIFMGDSKNTNAVKAGLGINWAVKKVLRPRLNAKWKRLPLFYKIHHGVGIATGKALIVRGGVRDNNDLVSIGETANVAAKLSDLRGPPDVYITHDVYNHMHESARATDGRSMWVAFSDQVIGGTRYKVKGSTWTWRP